MVGKLKIAIQGLVNRFGYQVIRRDADVSVDNAFTEQLRLVGESARFMVEVGAADGRDTEMYARALTKSRILALEPLPESFEILRARCTSQPSITAINAAVSDECGYAEFNIGNWKDTSSLLKSRAMGSNYDAYAKSTHSISVKVVKLDDVCISEDFEYIDLLKMDAQGAELRILAGAADLLKREAIRVIYSEVHFTEGYTGSGLFHDLSLFLHKNGFYLHGLYNLVRDHRGRLLWGDAIFIHQSQGGGPLSSYSNLIEVE